MLRRLQQKWRVNGWRLVVILLTFAIGGSLTGYAGKRILHLFDIRSTAFYIPVYIITVTLLWPLIVLLVSIPLGQFSFFLDYIGKLLRRVTARSSSTGFAPSLIRSARSGADPATATSTLQPVHRISAAPGIRIAIFASGAGSNAGRIIAHFKGHPTITIAVVVCNKQGAGVIGIARNANIPVQMVQRKTLAESTGCLQALQDAGINFIVLAGFLLRLPPALVIAYPRKIINIHPALLPRFGGAGMYGHFVHEAVLQSGDKESGITIHYVDEQYDTGDIIFQARCPVLAGDTAQDVARRIQQLEHSHYPRVIEETLSIA